jgi:hypothetical protein
MQRARQVGEVGHRRDRDPAALPFLDPEHGGTARKGGAEPRLERRAVGKAVRHHPIARIAAKLGQLGQIAQCGPLRRCERGDADPAVPRQIDAPG